MPIEVFFVAKESLKVHLLRSMKVQQLELFHARENYSQRENFQSRKRTPLQ